MRWYEIDIFYIEFMLSVQTSLTLLDDFLRIKVECAPDSAYLLATVTEIASVVFNDYHDTTIVGVRLVRAVNAACTAYKQRLGLCARQISAHTSCRHVRCVHI
jgi:hypothetical protein